MSEWDEVHELYNIFYKRLKITVCRNGLVFWDDIRNRRAWTDEMLRSGETTIMEVMDEDTVYERMIEKMREWGWSEQAKAIRFKDLTGKELSQFDNS